MGIRKNSSNLNSAKTNKSIRKNPNVKNYVKSAGGLSYGDTHAGAKKLTGAYARRTGRAYAEAAPGVAVAMKAKSPAVRVAGVTAAEAGAAHGNYKSWKNSVKRLNAKKPVGSKKKK